jgi:hypothetical protein
MRACETRLPPASTTAMFMGCLMSAAFFSAAAMMVRASARVSMGRLRGWCGWGAQR